MHAMNIHETAEQTGAKPSSVWRFAARVLEPIVRALLAFGFSCDEMNQMVRKIAVDVALKHPEFRTRKKAFVTQAAVVTGLSRKEVSKLRDAGDLQDIIDPRQTNRATRVLYGWMNDPRYRGSDGRPRESLPLSAASGVSFKQLVREYGGDVPSRSIFDALMRNGTVEKDNEGNIRLLSGYYVPESGSDEQIDNVGILMHDALNTAAHDVRPGASDLRFLREWYQPYIPIENVPEARRIIREEAMECGTRIDERLAELAHREPLAHRAYQRAGIGMFYFQGQMPGEADD